MRFTGYITDVPLLRLPRASFLSSFPRQPYMSSTNSYNMFCQFTKLKLFILPPCFPDRFSHVLHVLLHGHPHRQKWLRCSLHLYLNYTNTTVTMQQNSSFDAVQWSVQLMTGLNYLFEKLIRCTTLHTSWLVRPDTIEALFVSSAASHIKGLRYLSANDPSLISSRLAAQTHCPVREPMKKYNRQLFISQCSVRLLI